MRPPLRLVLSLIILVGAGFIVLCISRSSQEGAGSRPSGHATPPAPPPVDLGPSQAHQPEGAAPSPGPGSEAGAGGVTAPRGDAPAIRFEEIEYRFGTARAGEKVKHTFVFHNRGKAPLVIGKIVDPCGCIEAAASPSEVAPGERGEIAATFLTQGYAGQQSKNIYVESNDPQTPRVELTMAGFLARDIVPDPAHIYLGAIAPDATASRTVRVTSLSGQPFRIESVRPTSPYIHLSKIRELDGKGYAFDVTIGPGLPSGRLSEHVSILTTSSQYPKVRVLILANVAPADGERP